MSQISVGTARLVTMTIVLALLSARGVALANADAPIIRTVDIGHGITLHYVELGKGTPVIFVHGSLSDGGYWADQIGPFAEHYRAIAYSRRYNYPNTNPARPGYSAVVDAEDLAAFIHALHLGKVVVIGHSYGALTALFLAAKHPELVRALVLAEPPAVSLLAHLPGDEAKTGKAMFEDIQRRMVAPMQQAFRSGNRDAGIAAFIDYVFNDPHAWDKMSESAREETLRDAHEWDVMMRSGILFPDIEPQTIRKITAPVLLLSGAKSYPFLGLITEELAHLLPNRETIVLPDAGHQMWYQAPDVCRKDVEAFLVRLGIRSSAASGLTASDRFRADSEPLRVMCPLIAVRIGRPSFSVLVIQSECDFQLTTHQRLSKVSRLGSSDCLLHRTVRQPQRGPRRAEFAGTARLLANSTPFRSVRRAT